MSLFQFFGVSAIRKYTAVMFGKETKANGANGVVNGKKAHKPHTRKASVENRLRDTGIWKDAPLLTGETKFEPLPDVKNIMITGGAGFM